MATNVKLNKELNIVDCPMGINDLNLPKMRDMSDIEPGVYNGAILDIIRLILLKKGTYPDHPEMGVDIKGRYRFAFDSEIGTLQSDIKNQIIAYLPEVLPVDVVATLVQNKDTLLHQINLSIVVNEIEYQLVYDISSNTLVGIQNR